MNQSYISRVVVLVLLPTIALAMVVVSSCILWPQWQEYHAVHELLSVLAVDQEPDPLDDAIQAVQRFNGGEPAVEPLIQCFKLQSSHVNWRAEIALCRLGSVARIALVRVLTDEKEEPRVRASAARTLGKMKHEETAPVLIQSLKDSQPLVRAWAAWALVFHAPEGRRAISDLMELLIDEDPLVRRWAAFSLSALGSEAKVAVTPLIQSLDDHDMEVKKCAILALGAIGPDARDAIPALTEAMKNPELREAVTLALERIHPTFAGQKDTKDEDQEKGGQERTPRIN